MDPTIESLPPEGEISSLFDGIDYISTYTRAQALEDGLLVDVTATARAAGFLFPVALTRAAWCDCVEVPAGIVGQDEAGRLWDVLFLAGMAVRGGLPCRRIDATTFLYEVHVRGAVGLGRVELMAVCGPGDTAAPVITIGLPADF